MVKGPNPILCQAMSIIVATLRPRGFMLTMGIAILHVSVYRFFPVIPKGRHLPQVKQVVIWISLQLMPPSGVLLLDPIRRGCSLQTPALLAGSTDQAFRDAPALGALTRHVGV